MLVDDHQVCEFQYAAFHALKLVAACWRDQQKENVRQIRDGNFRLPDACRLDDDDVEACLFKEKDSVLRVFGNAAERQSCRRRPHIGVVPTNQIGHPGLVAKN